MSDMKCPICGQELKNINLVWFCENESCKAYDWTMEEAAWQELIRTRKALDLALAELQEIDGACDDNKYTDNLYVGLDGHDTRNIALDVKKAIAEITALEQKENNNDRT